jgi:hypothetical protein
MFVGLSITVSFGDLPASNGFSSIGEEWVARGKGGAFGEQ